MISVCMATYNGEKYIHEQMSSILPQLCDLDEIIVCDDASVDKTVAILESFCDNRIKLFRNSSNLGHVKNFEKAISLANGEYIFLSDQDDIWEPNKIKKTIDVFERRSNISLIYHNLHLIDESGILMIKQFPQYYEGQKVPLLFLMRQLIKPQIFGCACAMKRSKIETLLPFPSSVYAHDHWISLWAALNGRVYFIKDALVKHRQHNYNLSPKKSRPLITIVKSRLVMFQQVLIALYRRW